MKNKKTANYKSDLVSSLIQEISQEDQRMTDRKMILAAKIDETMKNQGIKKGEFAKTLDKHPSEITRWLSGTHNFTIETLWEIGDVLGINLVNIDEPAREQVIYVGSIDVAQDAANGPCLPNWNSNESVWRSTGSITFNA